jgi:hypothetical protein
MPTPIWTNPGRCAALAYLDPIMRAKAIAVRDDVQAHFDPNKVRIIIYETGRSVARQRILVRDGKSRTMNSQHLNGRAADLVPYVLVHGRLQPTWDDLRGKDGRTVWELIKSSAAAHGLYTISWDGPHIQLDPVR